MGISMIGKLILQLENDIASYISLHKEKQSHHDCRDANIHKISIINIASNDFIPGEKFYEFVVSELKKIDNIKFDLILKWKPKDDIRCESIKEYFQSRGFECLPCEQFLKQEICTEISVPSINFDDMNPTELECCTDWIGTQICGIDWDFESDKYVSNFHEPEYSEKSNLLISTYQGFYTSNEIYDFLKKVRNLFSKDRKMPFIALAFNGYQCCYVDSKKFGEVSSEDKLICLFISPQSSYLAMTLNV